MKASLALCACVAALTLTSFQVSEAPPPYSLSYNYFDEMAQSYCAASRKYWTFAIRRNCVGIAQTCHVMCAQAKTRILGFIGNQRRNVGCFDAIHIKKNHYYRSPNSGYAQPDPGQVIMGTYGYGLGGCSWRPNHCGPNYCCCRAY